MSFTLALSQASFHNNWTIAWQKKVLHLLTFSGTLQLFIKSAWQKMCSLLPHFSRHFLCWTLFSLSAKKCLAKKSAWEPGSPVPTYSTPLRTRSKTSLLAGVAKEKLSTLALAWADKDAKVDKGEIDFINMGEGFVSTRMRRLRRIPQWLSTGWSK